MVAPGQVRSSQASVARLPISASSSAQASTYLRAQAGLSSSWRIWRWMASISFSDGPRRFQPCLPVLYCDLSISFTPVFSGGSSPGLVAQAPGFALVTLRERYRCERLIGLENPGQYLRLPSSRLVVRPDAMTEDVSI